MSLRAINLHHPQWRVPAVCTLLHPREHTRLVAAMLGLGLALGAAEMRFLGWPLWSATATVLALLLVPGMAKWRVDLRRYGWATMLLSVLLAAQGFHTIEHLVQWAEFHIVHLTARESNGLLSAANAEWVHFVWNWAVLAILLCLLYGRMRNLWFWLLLVWATAHTLEHTYLFVRYLEVLTELRRMGITSLTAQGLPGVLGRDGWLTRSAATQGTAFSHLPGLTTAPRLDVHFWWNIGETVLLLFAANTFLRKRWGKIDTVDPLHNLP